MIEILVERFNYIPIIILMMIGLYVVVATGNLVKRLVGLSIFQTSVFLLYITIGKVFGGSPPIIEDAHGGGDDHGAPATSHASDAAAVHGAESGDDHGVPAEDGHAAETAEHHAEAASDYASDAGAHAAEAVEHVIYSNPLPHVLILTAIVVGVATLAVGLALVVRIREAYGTIEDDALNAADYSLETGGSD